VNQSGINKILVLGMPRSGTTIIQKLIANQLFQLYNFIEPFNVSNPDNIRNNIDPFVDPYTWTQKLDQGVFKLLAINFHTLNIKPFVQNGIIDHCVIIDRGNLIDCCLSLCYSELTGRYHYRKQEIVPQHQFVCTIEYMDNWLKIYKSYQQACQLVLDSGIGCDQLSYEKFMEDQVQYIAGRPLHSSQVKDLTTSLTETKLCYRQLCDNYQMVEQYLNDQLERQ